VTEYHGGGKCLTRVRLRYRFVTTTVIINLLFLAVIVYRDLNSGVVDWRILVPYALFLLFLATRARRLKRRVAEIVDVAAYRLGLQRIKKQPL
jgi:hypothetical protein